MLRVNSNSVLVVPPFECAWLSGEEYVLKNGEGCISFEVKGDNDVTLIMKSQAGSRRWQHIQADAGAGGPQVDPNYTIILGSHRNRCLKIEKNGNLCCMAEDVPGSKLARGGFSAFWVDYNRGTITIGAGAPGTNAFYRWRDASPLFDVRYVGLSSWDNHVGYKNIRVGPAVNVEGGAGAAPVAAEPLGVPPLAELASAQVVAQLCPRSACEVLEVAERVAPTLDSLACAALGYVATHVEEVLAADAAGLAGLPAGCMRQLLTHPELSCSEKTVFDALMAWHAGNSGGGGDGADEWAMAELQRLLPLVRFPLMGEAELQEVASHRVAARSAVLQALLEEARASRQAHATPSKLAPFSVQGKRLVHAASAEDSEAAVRFQRRHPPSWVELIYISNGDANGVCHYLGTNYGAEAWVNPVLAGRMCVRASSPACRYTDPRALVGGGFCRTSFAGPRLEPGGGLASWWLLDLGEAHRLVCNYYTLRHDGSTAFARSWKLQGSLDGEAWADLRVHAADSTLKLPGQYGSWPVGGPAAATPMRFFRLLLTGPTADAGAPWNLCASNVELYGYFFRTDGARCGDSASSAARSA